MNTAAAVIDALERAPQIVVPLVREVPDELVREGLDLAIRNRYDPAVPALERFLTVQGRRKFVKPLIETLAEDSQWGRLIATRVYRQARASYHPITQRDLDKLKLGG